MMTWEGVTDTLKQTFIHVPGVGPLTEQRLWREGILSWEDYFAGKSYRLLPPSLCQRLDEHLEESVDALALGHARHFETLLPAGEVWRIYPEFSKSVAFLDIETTGLFAGANDITVIGLFDGEKTKVFIRGVNLADFAEEIGKYALIVTFNGKQFDLPFIRRVFGELPPHQAHIDLRYPLRKLGYTGGLKAIEAQLGLEREGVLKGVNGFLAVLLWKEYEAGNERALDTLIRYNLEDVVNLQHLADFAYNQALARLPIAADPIPVHLKWNVQVPFDPDLIQRLMGWVERLHSGRIGLGPGNSFNTEA